MYCTDLQVEIQIRILLKDKYVKLCQKCDHRQSHYDSLYTVSKKISYYVSLFYRNNSPAKVLFS